MKKRKIILVVTILFSIVLGFMALYYPKAESQGEGYFYETAKKDVEVIAKEPHSSLYHKEALERVRQYIISELEKIKVDTGISFYADVKNKKGQSADIHNIYGVVEGSNKNKGSYILLVSHYDSAGTNPQQGKGYSYGAADDGYGVATILEVLREIQKSGRSMVNGIKILITDGEEMNLLGSREEVRQNPSFFEDVSYAINLEARGTSGPVILFESSKNNRKVMEFYKNVDFPIVTSFATELYKGSQRSDFYYLNQLGIPGINLSVIDGVERYHTEEDC